MFQSKFKPIIEKSRRGCHGQRNVIEGRSKSSHKTKTKDDKQGGVGGCQRMQKEKNIIERRY